MNKLTIEKLTFKNFKGIKALEVNPNGNDLSVSGDNGTGKTTIADGFFWLLFDKDSSGKTKFNLKPLDKNNQEKHKINTEVEGTLNFNGKTIVLKKRYYEKWTKERGSATKTFSGHTIDHFVDGVPESKGVFDSKVSGLINQNIFKLVTNPYEFNNIKWEVRRNILLEICGDVSDNDVIAANDKLSALADILGDCTIFDHKKKVTAKKREINKEIEMIPVRIDEVSTSIKDLEPVNEKEKNRLEASLDETEKALLSLKSNEALSAKRLALNNVKSEIIQVVNNHSKNKPDTAGPIQEELRTLKSDRFEITSSITVIKNELTKHNSRKKITSDAMTALRERWAAVDKEKQTIKTQCPACNQDLPEDEIDNAVEKFNNQKAKSLKAITTEGKSLGNSLEDIGVSIKDNDAAMLKLNKSLEEKQSEIDGKEKELDSIAVDASMPDTSSLKKKQSALESEILALENGSMTQENTAKGKIVELKSSLAEIATLQIEHNSKKNAIDRIADLEEQEKKLAKEYEKLEADLYLIEQFTVKKVEMLEGQINEKFKLARFKLFQVQVNGGIDDCCETFFDGVQFNHGLNSAARVNVGLDIISTLSEHYGFSAPVFVDNAESVNTLIPIDTQVITLNVTKDKKLVIK